MPEQRVTEEMILKAAFEVLQKSAEAALSARTIAEKACCSVQPIYSLFGDMETLVEKLYEYARQWVKEYNRSHKDLGSNLFESNGFAHLMLAQTEKNLFHFLYLSPHMKAHSIEDMFMSVAQDGVLECIQELGGLSPDEAYELYLNMIIYTHGLAAMLATGASFSQEELSERINSAFQSFVLQIRSR